MDRNKLRKLNIKDFVKDKSTVSRLQSLRLPRDLSLGGTKSSKKVYKPNLNVVRNKHNVDKNLRKGDRVKQKREKIEEKHKFLQSNGIFSGGVGSAIVPRVSEKKVYIREKPKTETVKPTVKKMSWKVNETYESSVLDQIIQYNDSSDSDVEEKVPFEPFNYSIIKGSPNDFKTDEQFGTLPDEYSETENLCANPMLTLWKLPDSFTFRKNLDKSSNKSSDCLLSDLPEGKIGKIFVRKSGKLEVCIGNSKYNLDSMDFETFSEQFMALDVATQTCSVLGDVGRQFILNPDWTSLLC